MRHCVFLFAASVMALASPIAAQDVVFAPGTGEHGDYTQPSEPAYYDDDNSVRDSGYSDLTGRISDPAVQDGVAATVEQMAGAMMRMPVGPMVQAIENARPGTVKRHLRRDATLADVAGRDARYLPEELGERSRETMGMIGGFARAMAVMMPEFERMGRDIEESVRNAKAQARPDRN